MSAPTSILLQGGTLLLHDSQNHIVPTVADLLVKGQFIKKIGGDIPISDGHGTKVIDCRGKIVSPGFVDTHRHLWQTQHKGMHPNNSLVEYFPRGNFTGGLWTKEDLFWGQLAGALESIEAGTTTVVDHSSCNITADHPQAAIQAVLSAGLREIYCYTPARRILSKDPFKVEDDYFSDENHAIFRALASAAPYGNGLVHVGYAMDNIYLPAEQLEKYYADLRDPTKGKAKLITTHLLWDPLFASGTPSGVEIMANHGLLGPDILFSHANNPHRGDGALLKKTGAFVSSTANTELQMGTFPVALKESHYDNASLGADCQSWGTCSMVEQMRLTLQSSRAERGEKLKDRGLWSRHTGFDVEQVFNLATLGGAKAAGLQDEIGTLKEGMKADIVVFSGSTPSMLAVAEEDPVAAIMLHSNPSDIDAVLIDGAIRKEEGKLAGVLVVAAPVEQKSVVKSGTKLSWKDVSDKVMESRQSLKEKAKEIDFKSGEEFTIDKFYMSRQSILEK